MLFWIIFLFVILQRGIEILIARRNEKWMMTQGAYKIGNEHYKYIVTMHVLFLLSLFLEWSILGTMISKFFGVFFLLFLLTQVVRIWAISSLGRYWNTKIIIVPNNTIISKGPYKFIRHPNYLIVGLEIILIPLLFEAYITGIVFTIINILVLSVRIPIEEKALMEHTNYTEVFSERSRFVPKSIKK